MRENRGMQNERSLGRLVLRKGLISLVYVGLALVLEWMTFSLLFGKPSFPTVFWLDLIPILVVGMCLFVLPAALSFGLGCLFLIGQAALGIANHAYYQVSETIVTLDMLSLLGEATGVAGDFLNYGVIVTFIVAGLASCCILGGCCFVRRSRTPLRVQTALLLVMVFVLLEGALGLFQVLSVQMLDASTQISQRSLYETLDQPLAAYRTFGTYGYYTKQMTHFAQVNLAPEHASEEEITSFLAEGGQSETSYVSDYTGALQGQNLVLIVIESGEWSAINRDYTPTLYAMATQGIAFTQFYGKNKTNVSEELSLLGGYHIDTPSAELSGRSLQQSLPSFFARQGYTTNYFHANNADFYQRNTVYREAFAFDHCYFYEDMPFLGNAQSHSFAELASDNQMMHEMLDAFAPQEPFFTMMMSLTSHGGYTSLLEAGKDYSDMTEAERKQYAETADVKGQEIYFERIQGYPGTFVPNTPIISTAQETPEKYLVYKRYQAGLCDLDAGVNALVAALQQKGMLSNTAFFLYSDHSAYYNAMNYYAKDLNPSEFAGHDNALYRIPCFLWSGKSMDLCVESPVAEFSIHHSGGSGLKGEQIDKYCNTFDILPTLLQLYGYSYAKNLYAGASAFSDEYSLFVSRESGVLDDRQYWNGLVLERNLNDGLDDSYAGVDLLDAYAEYLNKQYYLDSLIACDYFAKRDIVREGLWQKIQ